MARHSILDRAVREWRPSETKRKIVREAKDRYRQELLNEEERTLVLDRVLKLRRELGVRS
jgi:hypothetical protein